MPPIASRALRATKSWNSEMNQSYDLTTMDIDLGVPGLHPSSASDGLILSK